MPPMSAALCLCSSQYLTQQRLAELCTPGHCDQPSRCVQDTGLLCTCKAPRSRGRVDSCWGRWGAGRGRQQQQQAEVDSSRQGAGRGKHRRQGTDTLARCPLGPAGGQALPCS